MREPQPWIEGGFRGVDFVGLVRQVDADEAQNLLEGCPAVSRPYRNSSLLRIRFCESWLTSGAGRVKSGSAKYRMALPQLGLKLIALSLPSVILHFPVPAGIGIKIRRHVRNLRASRTAAPGR